MKPQPRYIVAAILLTLLYSCNSTQADEVKKTADPIAPPAVEMQILGPKKIPAGVMTQFHAQVPEGSDLAWRVSPETKGWYVDSNKTISLLGTIEEGVYTIGLAISLENKAYILQHPVQVGKAPDPGPDPPDPDPPIPPDPNAKWQVRFFLGSDPAGESQLDNLTDEQVDMLTGLKFRKEFKAKGHLWLGVNRYGAIPEGGVSDALKPWWESVKGDPLPRIAFASRDTASTIQDYPLPKTKKAFWELLEGKQ